ncbi:hypothetical protein GCM10029976_077430 [Kribbella albertanoniae]|uniref:Uncharacterized protein n=1 Tax=Kribbella albertanoniae TaxID=1266829 RepID=A0A4R4Q5X2_9ACTN|nr:hypothetical protein [Kribbella albertanoniae]TDC30518.1 hypothetical protein E1261_13050 [Kribbella albertanoniae]
MPEPREGNLVGIDPVAFKAMNTDLAKVKALIDANLPKLRTAFAKIELQTGRIERLAAVSRWIDSEMPMLQRRQLLAQQLQKEALQFGVSQPMVRSESTGNFATTEAAVARAKALAAQYKEGELPAAVWDEVMQNQHDPDFAEAFVKAIGPEAARLLGASTGNPEAWNDRNDPAAAGRYVALANLFATASHRGVITDDWLDKFPGLVDLMRHGTWNNGVLVRAGQRALDSLQVMPGNNKRTAEVLTIVARSPIAAAQLYASRLEILQRMMQGELAGWTSTSDPALGDPLGKFLTAATVDARKQYEGLRTSATWPNPTDELVRNMLLSLKDRPGQTPFAGVQKAYTAIVTEYFDDLYQSVSGPMVPKYFADGDPGRQGVEAPREAWSAIVQQAMWNPEYAAALSLFFQAKYQEKSQAIDALTPRKGATAQTSLWNWHNGQFRGWFTLRIAVLRQQKKDEVAAYNAKVQEYTGYIIDTASAGALAGGGVSGVTTAAGKTISGLFKSSTVTDIKGLVASWFEREVEKDTLKTEWATDSSAWQVKARDLLKTPAEPVTDASGHVWTGDPGRYEKMYGAKFTTGSESAPFLDVASMSPAGRRAFAAWLEDPAVQQAIWSRASPELGGYQASISGG